MQCKHANGILEISCKWFWFLSIRKFSLVIMCSELSLQAVPPHLIMFLRSLNVDVGFQDEGVNNDAGRDNPRGQGPPGD